MHDMCCLVLLLDSMKEWILNSQLEVPHLRLQENAMQLSEEDVRLGVPWGVRWLIVEMSGQKTTVHRARPRVGIWKRLMRCLMPCLFMKKTSKQASWPVGWPPRQLQEMVGDRATGVVGPQHWLCERLWALLIPWLDSHGRSSEALQLLESRVGRWEWMLNSWCFKKVHSAPKTGIHVSGKWRQRVQDIG